MPLNKRQDLILDIIENNKNISISGIIELLKNDYPKISRITINRDLKILISSNYIIQVGRGRNVTYQLSPNYLLIQPVDVEAYFKIEPDKRKIKSNFNFEIFPILKNIFTKNELQKLDKLNEKYLTNLNKIVPQTLKKELERLTIELSWKSSKIEGNTYSLLETEQLITKNIPASGHPKEEAVMILNHKKALDYIWQNKKAFQKLSLAKIENIHTILTQNLNIPKNIRKSIVRVTGTKYFPLDNEHQIKEALNQTIKLINKEKNVFCKALIIMILIAYIQPFLDGNKRTSRLVGNAVLLAGSTCPLSYRSINEIEYKKATLLFYEQNNLSYFKKLFIEQFEFAVNNYF